MLVPPVILGPPLGWRRITNCFKNAEIRVDSLVNKEETAEVHLLTLAPSLGPTEAEPQAADGGIMGNLSGASNPENVAGKETLNSDIKYNKKSFG